MSPVQSSPEPSYIVERADGGGDVTVLQSQLIGAESLGSDHALGRIQRWYAAQCNEEWEHAYGVTIGTLDNPGWSLTVELQDTPLMGATFAEIKETGEEICWYHCRVRDGKFEAFGGPHMLGKLADIFLKWADSVVQHTV